MLARLFALPRRAMARLRGGPPRDADVAQIYRAKDYLAAYSEHTDRRVAADPHEAVGGMWEAIGALQLDFLKGEGLLPEHSLLDIGCGTLRGGRHFIAYLDAGKYSGLDISAEAIRYGEALVREEGLAEKAPRLVLSQAKDLKLAEFAGQSFDYLLAQSVFTHLRPEDIEECFAHIGRVMHSGSAFYFTFHRAPEMRQTGLKDFRYPLSHFEVMARRYGHVIEDRSTGYPHPRGQRMVRLTRSPG